MKAPAIKYLAGIIFCEIVLLLSWINLGPDADISKYQSVQTALANIQTTGRPEFLLASAAIRNASDNFSILKMVIVSTSLLVIILSFLIGFPILKNRDQKL